MSDFAVCIGCGDIPTNDLTEDSARHDSIETVESIQEKNDKGYIKDSCGRWYDPTNYFDSYYADW